MKELGNNFANQKPLKAWYNYLHPWQIYISRMFLLPGRGLKMALTKTTSQKYFIFFIISGKAFVGITAANLHCVRMFGFISVLRHPSLLSPY